MNVPAALMRAEARRQIELWIITADVQRGKKKVAATPSCQTDVGH